MRDYEQIKPDKTVCILGTRLTAVDAALKLKNMNHKGKIIMASRSGLLPTVFGKDISSYTLKHITTKTLSELKNSSGGYLKLGELAYLFGKKLNELTDNKDYLISLPISSKDISSIDWINNEIIDAEKGASSVQQVLFALYPLTATLWSMLSYEDQARFLNDYNSLLNNYLAAFPLDNAYKIKEMLSSGYIEVCGNLTKVEYSGRQFNVHVGNDEIRTFDYLINTTGPGYDPTKVVLFKKMLDRGLISKHSFGGIQVDFNTFQVISGEGKINQHLFAIGELTRGVCLLTSELGIITAQANQVTAHLVNQLVGDRVGIPV